MDLQVGKGIDSRFAYEADLLKFSTDVSDFAFTYTSSCTPPGQVVFPGLTAGTYTLTVEKPGYTTYSVPVTVGQLWEEVQVLLAP